MMLKKIVCLIVVIFLLLPPQAVADHASEEPLFSDIEFQDPYYNYVRKLYEMGIVKGNPDGTLGGDDFLVRAELVTIVVRAANIQIIESDNNCFPDVQEEWFAGAVCAMVRLGHINGYPDGLFRPSRSVTAGEAAKIILNALTQYRFQDLSEAIALMDSMEVYVQQLSSEENINRKETFARLFQVMVKPVFMEQVDNEGNPFNPETDTIMVIEPGGPVFYTDYNQTQFERHFEQDPIVLFFHASWCPLCQQSNRVILDALEGLIGGAVIFKVDYDTEIELRQQYGITYQDTFVAINADGEVVTIDNGMRSAEEVQEIIDLVKKE